MSIRFAINGFGRIGRALVRVARERPELGLELAAINDLAPAPTLAHLLAHDTLYGRFAGRIEAPAAGRLRLEGRELPAFGESAPERIPWPGDSPLVVVESSGRFTSRAAAAGHLRAPVNRVVISAPAADADLTICLGINAEAFDPRRHRVVSNASCTTNCLAPVARVLIEEWGIRNALMSTVHCYTNGQNLLDFAHADPRRARAAAANIIPTTTSASHALLAVLPELSGRIEGYALRVPNAAVSLVELVADLELPTTVAEVRVAFRRAAASGPLAGILGVTDEELVSSDFLGDRRSAIVDLPLVQVVGGRLVRVVAWYDNEWGYSNRLAELLAKIGTPAPA